MDDIYNLESTETVPQSDSLAKVIVFLYFANRPNFDPELTFRHISVDGIVIQPDPEQLPGNQGVSTRLGTYERGKNILISWAVETGVFGSVMDISVGIYRKNINDRTFIRKFPVDIMTTYEGNDSVLI